MPWLVMRHVSLCSEGNYHQVHRWIKLGLFTSLTRVGTSFCHFIWTALKFVTELLIYPKPDSNTVNPSEKATQLVRKSSASPPTRGQIQKPSCSSSDAHAAHGASPFQKSIPEELDHPTSQQITRKQKRPTGASGRPRRVPEEDNDGEGSAEHHAKLVAPDAPSGKEIARLEDGRLIELERQLSETLVAKAERDRRIVQLTDELSLKSALLEQAEANAAKVEKRAGLELCELQAKFDESLLSRDHALEQAEANAAEEKKRAELELRELQARLDESLLSRSHALEQAQSVALCGKRPAPLKPMSRANENSQRCVPSSRRASPNRRDSACDSRTRRMIVTRAKQRQTHIVPRLRQVLSIRMRTESCIGLWGACKLWKPKWHHCGGTRKALK
jgi:hypothetical protein